ncbi:MAG: hypothetical protein J6B45_01510 [Clostridia bacterium]|nr:hypothetical protein [Clostridia bacterium]
MNYLDIYYRALVDYRKNTVPFRECANQRISTAKADAKNDILTITRKICKVETDWVEAIEEGLVHVEKAIREERQFIRSNGEVVDIEKVKNVSRDSVEHLSRHSNLITRYEEGEDIIPDRLYTVERLSDFAVYENRFLYMLLCYLRDFITLRYNKILELEHTYNGSMTMNKNIVMTKRNLVFEVKLEEERKDDLYLKRQSESRDIIVRIGNQLKLVLAFLATPLMQEVSKTPMLKPPITKTNVLRMNHNFRGALKLYEFVSAYDKAGYEVEERVTTQSPFRMDIGDEMAEVVMLASFLTYEHGLGLKGELQEEYDLEEERRKEEEKRRLIDQLKALRHRIRENGGDPEEYMLMLERTNRLLQEDREKLQLAREEIEQLKGDINTLEKEKNSLNEEITRLNGEIVSINEAHAKEIEEINESHIAEINTINASHEEEKAQISAEYENKLDTQRSDYENQLEVQRTGFEETIGGLTATLEKERTEHKERVAAIEEENALVINGVRAMWQAEVRELKGTCQEKDVKIGELKIECDNLEERRKVSDARLVAIRSEHGLVGPTEDFTSQKCFEEMESQLDAFISFFKKQWNITKKSIREKARKEYKEAIKAEKEAKKAEKEAKRASKNVVEKTEKQELDEIVQKLKAEVVKELRAVPLFEIPTGDEDEGGVEGITNIPQAEAKDNAVTADTQEPLQKSIDAADTAAETNDIQNKEGEAD